ncbi:MAG: ribonuclease III [Proteobacteria bacterium]|nr:ribonuclease III [Pseudomonadota bacterium]
MQISQFLEIIGYQFYNPKLLDEALTHPSLSKEAGENYQRLEFLGDAVLSMVVAELLIKEYPQENEGQLSKRQANLVSGDVISKIATQIKLNQVMKLSQGEKDRGGKENKRNLENTMEALIGAIYLDSDFENTKKFITKYWQIPIKSAINPPQDPVSLLQEIVQSKTKQLPQYKINRSGGAEHNPVFSAILEIENVQYKGEGPSKKEAQKNAAKAALKEINRS